MKFKIPEKFQRLKRILLWVVAFILLLQVAYFVFDYYETKRLMKELAKQPEVKNPEPVMLFKLPIDSFNVVPGKIKSGQNLSDILSKQGVSMAKIDEISKKTVLTFDVRKMKINNPYYFFMNKKETSKVEYFIYEIDAVEYVVYQLKDSLQIYKEKKPIESLIKTASGVITSSLWKTMETQALNTDLAMALANNIYAWSIDFYGIQKGDKFRIVYEENFAYGKSIGVGRIFASEFIHAGKSYSAFLFTQKNKKGTDEDSYFDGEGKSLVKAFLKAPLEFSRISSKFSNARFHPVLKIYRAHHGVDYAAPTGTPVRSIGAGTIVAKGYQASGGGNFLKVKHNNAYLTSYMHLSKFAAGISVGTRVDQGDVIGYVGSTGLSSGPHLDFRVFLNGTAINPLDMKAPDGDPVNTDRMKDYTINRDTLMAKLNAIKNF